MMLPDLASTKASTDIDGGELVPGDLLEYTLTISNTGPRATYEAGQVGLSDAIPANTFLVPGSASASPSPPATVTEGDPLTASLGTIAVDESATVIFQVQVDEQVADGTVIENFATITERCLDDRVTNTTQDQVVSRAELTVSMSADPLSVQVGQIIDYTYTLTTGGGNVRLNNVSVTDNLCDPVVYQDGDTNSDGYLDWSGSGSGAEIWVYQCSYTVESTDLVGPLVNTATARGVAPSAGQVANTDSVTVTIINTPPTAVDDPATTDTDTPVAVDVLANDTDPNGHALIITDVQSPTNQVGGAAINDNGTPGIPGDDFIDYDPPPGFAGTDTFTYTIDDGFGGADTATVTVTVSSPATGPAPDPQFLDIEGARILWSAPAAATGYHLYRGDLAAVRASGVYAQDPQTMPNAERFCWLIDTGHEDSFDPPAGQVIFYLVTADDGAVESGLGEDSEGIARTNDNPCR
jgi:uncharacterized repeat protein (TIGR01451 family)